MNFVGQTELISQVSRWTWSTLPAATLFIGEAGSGRHTLANMLAGKLGIELVNIGDDITHEQIVEYSLCPINKLYLIDLEKLLQKDQNQFLKFIEQPAPTVKVVLIASPNNAILETILNRCIEYRFVPYSKEELTRIKPGLSDDCYELCQTPGKLLLVDNIVLDKLIVFIKKFVDFLSKANFANTCSVALKINYSEEFDKFDFQLFFKVLLRELSSRIASSNDDIAWKAYTHTVKCLTAINGIRINKESFMLSYLAELWSIVNDAV